MSFHSRTASRIAGLQPQPAQAKSERDSAQALTPSELSELIDLYVEISTMPSQEPST